jgi:hypothetical protein
MRWRLQQLHNEGSENPAQVLSTARNAIRRVRMVMRGLPHRELSEEGKRLIGSIQHEAAQQTKQARLRCAADCNMQCIQACCAHQHTLRFSGCAHCTSPHGSQQTCQVMHMPLTVSLAVTAAAMTAAPHAVC